MILPVAGLLLASCGKDSADPSPTAGVSEPQKVQRIKSGEMGDDDFGKIADRYGAINANLQGGGASEAGKTNSQYSREIAKREFATKDYSKKAFWGDKDYARKVYGGDLDGSRFQQAARQEGQGAREGTLMARDSGRTFTTARHAAGAAREADRPGIERVSDARTDFRRSVYKQPDVTDWRSQRALTVEDTNRMLGR